MVDPLGHEHADGRSGEEQGEEGERIGARVDQPPGRQRDREQQQQIGQQRRDRDRPALGRGAAEQRPQDQDQSGDRQVDQPRPVDVRTAGGFSRCCARSNQPWPWSRPRTCIIRILSSVSPRPKKRMLVPAVEDEPGAEQQPEAATTHFQCRSSSASPRSAVSSFLRCRIFRALAAGPKGQAAPEV